MATGDYALVPQANQAPYHCLRCRRAENVIVLSQEPLSGYGIAYLCAICFGELADVTDFMRRADHNRALETVLREVEQLRLRHQTKEDELRTALADVRNFKERLSNGVRDLVDRGISDLLAGDGGGVPVAAGVTASELDGADDPAENGRAGLPADASGPVPLDAGPGANLLAGIAGLRARAASGDAGTAAGADDGSDQAGDVFDFIGEPDAR